MEILTESQMAARLDFRRPLQPEPDPPRDGVWCIPFEFGPSEKGTRISIAKAKEIAAELRASVAEAEKRELLHAFKAEQKRVESYGEQLRASEERYMDALQEVAVLKQKLRARSRAKVDKRK